MHAHTHMYMNTWTKPIAPYSYRIRSYVCVCSNEFVRLAGVIISRVLAEHVYPSGSEVVMCLSQLIKVNEIDQTFLEKCNVNIVVCVCM